MIVPVYNAGDTLATSIGDVLAVTDDTTEIVIVDDGSDDDTPNVIELLSSNRVTAVALASNSGPSAARNHGAATATGDWLVFLDADDALLPAAIESFRAVIEPGVGLITSASLLGDSDEAMPRGGLLPGSYAVSRSLFELVRGYDTRLRFAENSELEMRLEATLIQSRQRAISIDVPTVRRASIGQSRNYDRARMEAAILILEKHREHFAERPEERATHEAIVAVNATRVNELHTATRYATRAIRSRPLAARHYARLTRIILLRTRSIVTLRQPQNSRTED